MKKFLAFILLVSHINSSMLLPQVAEEDIFDKKGSQVDDINTVYEYIDQVILEHTDTTPEDEDDDSGQNFQMAKTIDHFYQPVLFDIEQPAFTLLPVQKYPVYINSKLSTVSFDIITPPPEA